MTRRIAEVSFVQPAPTVQRVQLDQCLEEVTKGVGPSWHKYRLIGATRSGLAAAKEGVGKNPQRYKLVEPGTIFYNPMRILLGSIAFLDEGKDPGITSPDYVVFKGKPGVLHSRWFYYWLRSDDGAAFIKTLTRGAVRERMLFRRLATAEIDLPSYDAQLRFAQQMPAIERARAAAEAQLEAAKALPAAYLRAVFDSPEARKWPRKRLRDILNLRKEIIHPRDNPTGAAIFVGLEHIQSVTGERLGSVKMDMAQLTGRKPRFYKGDIVYGYLRPYLNKLWLAEFDGLCSVDQYVYEVAKIVADVEFVAWFMRSPIYLERAPIDTTPGQLPRIRTEEVASVELNLPSLREQQRVAAVLNERLAEANRLSQNLEKQLIAINALPAALLRQAFTGKL